MAIAPLVALALLLAPAPAGAELLLPPGFTSHVYVTGEGFDRSGASGSRGVPAASTLAFDRTGTLYLARTGRRYTGGEIEDLWPIYRIPPGGGRVTAATERHFLHGPPLPNPQIAAIRGGHDVFVTTFDRDRKVGVLYRLVNGRAELYAGGTPSPGVSPLLRQPEGAAVDSSGNLYVADREQGVVVKLGPSGAALDPRHVEIRRPRVLAIDAQDRLWIGADAGAEAPWQRGPGEIWRIVAGGPPSLVLQGPVAAGMALDPSGCLFVADRQGGRVFVLRADGKQEEFARFTDGDAPRGLGFAPTTPETRGAGIAGDLFVITINRGAWSVNDVVRIRGPFEDFVRKATSSAR